MFDHAAVRFIVASLLFGAYGLADVVARGLAGKARPPRVRRPRWSHFIGFASVLFFYEAVARDGREILGGSGNAFGVVLVLVAMLLRFATLRGARTIRYPDLSARLLFYAALPIVIGSPRSFVLFTLAQVAIAVREAQQRDEGLAPPAVPASDGGPAHPAAAGRRIVPGLW